MSMPFQREDRVTERERQEKGREREVHSKFEGLTQIWLNKTQGFNDQND